MSKNCQEIITLIQQGHALCNLINEAQVSNNYTSENLAKRSIIWAQGLEKSFLYEAMETVILDGCLYQLDNKDKFEHIMDSKIKESITKNAIIRLLQKKLDIINKELAEHNIEPFTHKGEIDGI